MTNKTIEILQKLVSIPSWIDKNTDEREIGKWIYEFLKKNSNSKIIRQNVGGGRFNIIAIKGRKADILVTGHIDTVQPNSEWIRNPTSPEIIGNKMYGLGTSDMKSGIAIMLYLCTLPELKDNTAFLFYCDEEYDFIGMRRFIENYKTIPLKTDPKLIISLDGEGSNIGNSCRGLIEMKITVRGVTGHAARPKSGINAVTTSQKVIGKLSKWLKNFSSNPLGNSTLNIAYIKGGLYKEIENGEVVLGKEGNIIPDYCEYIVEIRVANEKLNAVQVKNFISKSSRKLGLRVQNVKIRHDLGSWITPVEELKNIVSLTPKDKIKSAKKSGYIDIQMLWKQFGKVPTFSLGAGEFGQSHTANEYVKISSVLKALEFYKKILTIENK